jgi:RHS repeat-associated protein
MWGKRVKLSGALETEVGYTGHHHHAKSGLVLTWFRAYDTEAGRWLSPDPLGEEGGMNLYGYVGGDPINMIDKLGLDGIYVHFDGYPISTPIGTHGFGHAAVISIDDKGATKYSEFGRYSCPGKVRRQKVPNVVMGTDGKATPASLKKLYDYVSKHYGKGFPVSAKYYDDADSKKMEGWIKSGPEKNPPKWNYPGSTCKDYARKAIEAGQGRNPYFGPPKPLESLTPRSERP